MGHSDIGVPPHASGMPLARRHSFARIFFKKNYHGILVVLDVLISLIITKKVYILYLTLFSRDRVIYIIITLKDHFVYIMKVYA